MAAVALFIIVACIVVIALLGGAYCISRIGWHFPATLLVAAAVLYGIYAYLAITAYPGPITATVHLWTVVVVCIILVLALFIVSTPVRHAASGRMLVVGIGYMILIIAACALLVYLLGPTGLLLYAIIFAIGQLLLWHFAAFSHTNYLCGILLCELGARAYPTLLLYIALFPLLALPATCQSPVATFLLVSASLLVTALIFVWAYRLAVHWCCRLYRPTAVVCCARHYVRKSYKCHHVNCINYRPGPKSSSRAPRKH